ncbi:MAG: F0F1 ATP synthase subunit B family protein [Thermoanaerobaculia bacterium]
MKQLSMLLLVLCLAVAWSATAQEHPQANDVAHGAEKASAETAHPNEEHGGPHAEKKFLGLPFWIWKLANMLLFLGLLVWLLRGPIGTAFAERTAAIHAAAAEARERRAKADQMAADIQTRLSQIEGEVRAIQDRARQEGERQKRDLIAAAEAEAAKILQSARNEVENRLKYARHELTEYAGELASERAKAILRERITEADQKKLFEESVRQVDEVQS